MYTAWSAETTTADAVLTSAMATRAERIICTCRKSNGSSLDVLTAAGPPTVQTMILEDLLKPDATLILGSVNMQLCQTSICKCETSNFQEYRYGGMPRSITDTIGTNNFVPFSSMFQAFSLQQRVRRHMEGSARQRILRPFLVKMATQRLESEMFVRA